ncbi:MULTISPECIES: hypothetical protein [unclassified Pseudomonas]|jgi:hypothetical protein|uniref:hypothetical protein n=1 Tax=Pseudomonas TaxID=286 RepID=UPI00119D1F15|nr:MULTISPECIES: hypothetical protein [unclassified Pseudomonas]TWC23686.1 hypothetical protein FBY05_10525 [Pseudomonas sp. SJZ083]TWC50084.1 hypothetical protein FBY01_105264 [Pseudomonas sp. SJZ077]
MLIAILHIAGAIFGTIALGVIVFLISSWEIERNNRAVMQDLSIRLGVAVEDLSDEKLSPRIVELTSERFSNDRFSNRFSDLCGAVRTVWDWLGSLLQIGTLVGVVWMTVTESLTNAVHAWWIVAIGVFFWIAGVLFALLCRLLTGRYPGQAKKARKGMAEFLSARRNQ